jgi:uncharacterized protein YgiM (DUF1202 family)
MIETSRKEIEAKTMTKCLTFFFAIFVCLGLHVNAAEAAMYHYKDANGVIRYTDNYSDIPVSQRKGIPIQEDTQPQTTQPPAVPAPTNRPSAAGPSQTETDQTPYQTNASGTMSDDARIDQLLKQKTALDAELSQLTKESLALAVEKKTLANNDEVKAYNEKVEKLNARVVDYEKRRALFQKEAEAFDARLKQKMRPAPPAPAVPPQPSSSW